MSRVVAIRLSIVTAIVLILELVCRLELVRPKTLVAPTDMVARLALLVQQPKFWSQIGFSAQCILAAFVMALIAGCTIAVALHAMPRLRRALEPLFASYYAIPFFVLNPLLVALMGMNAAPIIAVGFLYAVMAVIVGTLNGLDRIPSVLRRSGRSFRLNGLQQALLISLPAAAPYVFTGLKLGFGYSVTGVLGSEFILSTGGLGYLISFAYNNFDDRTMYALLLFLLVAVSVLTFLFQKAERTVEHRSGPSTAQTGKAASAPLSKILASLAVAIVLITAWHLVHLHVGDEALASPLIAAEQLVDLFKTPAFWGHITETAIALGLSLLISCVLGALIGIALGANATAGAVAEPVLVTLYALPKVTLYPVVLLLCGIGLTAKIVFGALYGMIPMILISMNAIRSMNPILRRASRSMRLSPMQTFLTVLMPATVPEIVTGIRVGFSITLLGVMIGEMFASRRGLGFLIMNGISVNDTATMMAVTALVTVFAVTVNTLLIAIERRMHRA